MSVQRILPFPGYVILEEYELKTKKTSGFQLPPTNEGDDVPRIGKILLVGDVPVELSLKCVELKLDKTETAQYLEAYRPYKQNMIVTYKKYQDHPIKIGTKEYKIVSFENLLTEIKEAEDDGVQS